MTRSFTFILVILLCASANAQEFSLIGGNSPRPQVRTQVEMPPQPTNTRKSNIPLTQEVGEDEDLPITPPEIVGGGDYEIGDLIELSVKPANPPANLHSVVYSWTVLPDVKITEWPDGSKVLFGTGKVPRTLNVVMTASYVFVDMDENNTILDVSQGALTVQTTVRIKGNGGGGGGNGDNGGGGGDQDPTFNSALAKNAYDWSKGVTSDAKAAEAKELQAAFLQVQQEIANGQFTGATAIAKIFEQTKTLNDRALGESKETWKPWFEQMTSYLEKAFNDKVLQTPEDFGTAWGQIAEGLGAIK
jgi:hypothetical protein